MHRYWDTGKAGFRTGILSNFVMHYPEVVYRADMRIVRKSKVYTIPNATVVDQNVILNHMLAAVKSLALTFTNI